MKRGLLIAAALAFTVVAGCAHDDAATKSTPAPVRPVATNSPAPSPTPAPVPSEPAIVALPEPTPTPSEPVASRPIPSLHEVFPHVRADLRERVVEFDAVVTPALVPDPNAPLFYLEVAVCTWNTREHETLLVTDAKPSHVHAALLLIGLEAGRPGAIRLRDGKLIAQEPSGSALSIEFEYRARDGTIRTGRPEDWAVSARTKETLAAASAERDPTTQPAVSTPTPGWVFAGSVMLPVPEVLREKNGPAEVYDADGAGTLIGLTTFGSETIAWSRVFSPEQALQEPEWVAKMDTVPPGGTPVVVRVRAR